MSEPQYYRVYGGGGGGGGSTVMDGRPTSQVHVINRDQQYGWGSTKTGSYAARQAIQ